MDLSLQPKPDIEIKAADKGIVSRKEYFVKKQIEEIRQYFFAGHLIRNWKPKAELIYSPYSDGDAIQYEYDFNREVQNCFVEDYAEEVYLRSPPPCFVITGKFGTNVSKLSEDIAREYGSVLIKVEDVVNQVIQTDTKSSKFLDRVLRLGVSLTLNFVLALLSYMAHTPEARHRGYVLSGLPVIPLDYDLSPEQQFNYLFTWENKPTVFVHVLFEDEDLVRDRINSRYEVLGECISVRCYDNDITDDDNDNEVDELLPVKEEEFGWEREIDIPPSRPWVQLPRDEESQVWSELELYDVKIKPVIDLINSRVDPQYFITVDSRVGNEFEIVKDRLSLLRVWKVPVAFSLVPQKTENEEEEGEKEEEEEEEEDEESFMAYEYNDIMKVIDEPPQTAFLMLFHKKTISPRYRWELSHYNYVCPVSLRGGEIVEGKSQYAVVFMKYIYFLKDEVSMKKFIQNPRPYVLPVRPKPPTRFIVLGYPFCGKTSLAKSLASEFSIPIINFNAVLRNDLEKKKEVYQEFCRQKAEYKEIIRLTAQAWKDWRLEEEQRICVIEEWIIYIQSLLSQRIEQFYSTDIVRDKYQEEYLEAEGEWSGQKTYRESVDRNLEVRGVSIADPYEREHTPVDPSSPSDQIVQAMKHENYDFNENGLEVEANLFFSSLWNSFSNTEENEKVLKPEADSSGEESEITVNWCGLLPPQSLSSLFLKKKPYTIRERRQSFWILLTAAERAYWTPSKLKTEFVKWRLPCYMDIPLCEIYHDNPFFLLKYCPEWMKERPQIPDAVDPLHPSVTEAGERAHSRASVVTIKHENKEIATLLKNVIEKAEKDGMRVSGDVISPGGWVVDDMTLDLDIWNRLARENVFADYVYFLTEPDPDFRRIINLWCDLHHTSEANSTESSEKSSDRTSSDEIEGEDFTEMKSWLKNFLEETFKLSEIGNRELDEIYKRIVDSPASVPYVPPFSVDSFSHNIFQNTVNTWFELKEESMVEESAFGVAFGNITTDFFVDRDVATVGNEFPIGVYLEFFTNAVLNALQQRSSIQDSKIRLKESKNDINFFISLLVIPVKLEKIKNWLFKIDKGATVREIDITDRTIENVYNDVRKNLYSHFIKKPRELESFEVEEIQKLLNKDESDASELMGENEEEEEVRIYGESGPLCIVNLERNILLPGKPEFVLRYYGKLYYFYNQDAKNKFIEDPEKYAPYYSPIRCLPPLRVFVMGPIGSGKTSLAQIISNVFSLHLVDFISFLSRKLIPHSDVGCRKFTAIQEKKLLLSENDNKEGKAYKEQFQRIPYEERRNWLENPLHIYVNEEKRQSFEKIWFEAENPVQTDFPALQYETIERAYESEGSDISIDTVESSRRTEHVSMKEIETLLNDYIQNKAELTDYAVEKSIKTLWTQHPFVTQGFILEGFPMRSSDTQLITGNNWIPDLVMEITLPENAVLERNIDNLMLDWDTKLKQETIEERLLEDTLNTIHRTLVSFKRMDLLSRRRATAILEIGTQINFETKTDNPEDNKDETKPLEKKVRSITSRMYERSSSRKILSKRSFESHGGSRTRKDEFENELPREVESKIHSEVEETLLQEFPLLEFNSVFETYNDAKARITADVVRNYRRDMDEIGKVKSYLKSLEVNWLEIDNTKEPKQNLVDVSIQLNRLKKRLDQKGEYAFDITMETAEKLLQQGYYFLSKFGRWCPVQVYRMKNPIHMFRPLLKRQRIFPVAYRNYIYFIGGENEMIEFIKDPIKYTFNEPHHPNIPLRIAVIGPPKSGKSTLCQRLGLMFDLKIVTMGTALRFVLESIPHTTLAKAINEYLQRGCFLPLSLKIEALLVCLNDPSCATQGFVFDGIPFDAAMTQSLAEKGKLPFVIISLVADPVFGKTNRANLDLEQYRLPYKQRVNLETRYREWTGSYHRFVQWNKDTYNNLYEVNAKLNVVDIFYEAYNIIRKSYAAILHYVEYCLTDAVLPLQYLCVSQHEYELRKSSLHNNCPVCWGELGKLNSSTNPPPRSGLVQYQEHFYWVCSNDFEKFSKRPKAYLPPNVPIWPKLLPKMINKKMFRASMWRLHGYGRCPVTRVDIPSSLDWEGSWDYAAMYDDEVFLCKNQELLNRFLSRPWRYRLADTKFEVDRPTKSVAVEQLRPVKVTSLPPIGFLEQTVADLLHEALQILGSVRPVYPNLSPTTTGCCFVALYLKVYNKRTKTLKVEREYLDFMLENCKAYRYKVQPLRSSKAEFKNRDIESETAENIDSESSEEEPTSREPNLKSESDDLGHSDCMLDLEAQADKKMWSAKHVSDKTVKMTLTENDELIEVPEMMGTLVVLKYQTENLRCNPLPPITNCLTYLYSCKPALKLPEKFNVNSLYQYPPAFSLPHPGNVVFNPDKQSCGILYKGTSPPFTSKSNLRIKDRAVPDTPSEHSIECNEDADTKFMRERFVPRFQLLDIMGKVPIPNLPKVVETEPISFNPHREYTYTLLLSQFFRITHVLRCYEWNESIHQLEYSTFLDKNLGLCDARSEFLFKPYISPSVNSYRSIPSFQRSFDAASLFYTLDDRVKLDIDKSAGESQDSLINFIHMLIFEKMDELFLKVTASELSYDSFELNIVSKSEVNTKPEIWVREVFPFPPLAWDVVSKPYYAYRTIPAIFEGPHLDEIAHERHVSLLDGIVEPNELFKFVRYPTLVHVKHLQEARAEADSRFYLKCLSESMDQNQYCVFDFFNLNWTSFMTYPFSWAYDKDIRNIFGDTEYNAPLLPENDNNDKLIVIK